jgi:hypothetical protein
MAEFQAGDRVLVNISAGIVPGADGSPDWQAGTVAELLPNGFYRVSLDQEIAGRGAEKDAAPEHVRRLSG